MKKQGSRFRILLPFIMVVVALLSAPPISQPQASTSCDPPPAGCIELTVFNEQACRCECPDQACCEFYAPFVPHGCEGFPSSKQSQ